MIQLLRAAFFTFSIFLCSNSTFAQDWDNYQSAKCGANIPDEFLQSSTRKYNEAIAQLANDDKKKREAEERFLLETTFQLDELLLSGKVLFDEPMSNYLTQVADKVLAHDPSLRKKLQFYVIKSPFPNAFSTQRGIIFVNIGLLARLENEAQLAFILCHEIAHFTENHVMESFLHGEELTDRKSDLYKEYKNSSRYDKLLMRSNYSKANELEADKLGFEQFMKTGYALDGIENTFDILKEANETYRELTFQAETLSSSYISDISKYLQLSKSIKELRLLRDFKFTEQYEKERREKMRKQGIKVPEDKSEPQLSTHPSVIERKEIIKKLVLKQNNISQNPSKELNFEKVRRVADYELCEIFLEKHYYFDAYYHTLSLINEYGNSLFLKLQLVKSLYGMAKFGVFSKLLTYKSLEVKGQYDVFKVLHLKKRKKNLLALSLAYDLLNQLENNIYLEAICEDLIIDLFEEHRFNKIDNWRKDSREVISKLQEDSSFTVILAQAKEKYEVYKERKKYFKTEEGKEFLDAWWKDNDINGYRLGLDKVLIFDPNYYKINVSRSQLKHERLLIDFVYSEEVYQKVVSEIKTSCNEINLNVELLDTRNSVKNIQRFNELALIKRWFLEKNEYNPSKRFIPSTYDKLYHISQKYDTEVFMNIFILSVSPKNRTHTYFYGYNVKERRPVMISYDESKGKITSKFEFNDLKKRLQEVKRKDDK